MAYETHLNLKDTELRLGLPGTEEREDQPLPSAKNNKRPLPEASENCGSKDSKDPAPPAK